MAFMVSPGVEVKEIDLTNTIPAVKSSTAGIACNLDWGPVMSVRTVSTEKDLVNMFGAPRANNAVDFTCASYFLKYSNDLKVVRAVKNAKNATTGPDAITINNYEDYENKVFNTQKTEVNITLTSDAEADSTEIKVSAEDGEKVAVGNIVVYKRKKFHITNISIDKLTITLNKKVAELITTGTQLKAVKETGEGQWIAKYPGSLGNSLGVIVFAYSEDDTAFDADDATFDIERDNGQVVETGLKYKDYASLFNGPPRTSDYVSQHGGANDEIHVVVYDRLGLWTGTAGSIMETFEFLSLASDAKTNDGATNYYKNVINTTSKYIWFGTHDKKLITNDNDSSVIFTGSDTVLNYGFSGGTNSEPLGIQEYMNAYALFADTMSLDLSLLIQPPLPNENEEEAKTLTNYIVSLAENRKDAVAFLSPPVKASTTLNPLDNVLKWANSITSSSYAFMDNTAIKVYDKYNDQFLWIPASSSIAGLCARTDHIADPWWSMAGTTRGQLLGVTKLAWNANQPERDALYQKRVNAIVTFPGEGTILFGDKTALAKPSAFDRINVRRLFIVLEKAIAKAARHQLFEFNDEFTRATFRNMVEPFLRDVQGRRGLYDFLVVCDETNNTPEVIDGNRFVGDIYLKPAKSINFITLNFIATRSGVAFSEITGKK